MEEISIMLCVLTACVSPGTVQWLELRDNKERLRQYEVALKFYIKSKEIDKIVFCDNSNYDYSYSREEKLAQKYGKQLEILKYKEDECVVAKRGKGYGEGKIIEYVMHHSKLLQNETYFYKITGRLIIKNIDDILKCESTKYNYFNKNMYCYQTIDTRFFGVNKEMYQKYLINAYRRVNDGRRKYLEHCFFETLQSGKISYRNHVPFPVICGMSGTKGKMYRKDDFIMRGLNEILSRTRLYNCRSVYCCLYRIYEKQNKRFEDM